MRQPAATDIISVAELNRRARNLLERELREVWIEAEISNLARPASGHCYFSLKDEAAQVRCAMFRGANRSLTFEPENGMAVLIHAKVGLYEARGEFQLVVDHMEEAGEGLLRRRFEALKAQLAAEGLFAEEHKQPLPALPRRIGIVTSPSGAAVRDILHILQRRFAGVPVTIYPTPVQGTTAASQIASAIQLADGQCDVIIVARGGGSLEDLWAFNEEPVARAIFACSTPVISGVGHETDITIADLVADLRAPTPSGAAEVVVPDQSEWLRSLQQLESRLSRVIGHSFTRLSEHSSSLLHRLKRSHPGALLLQRSQLLDDLQRRLQTTVTGRINELRWELNESAGALRNAAPQLRIQRTGERLRNSRKSLVTAMKTAIDQQGHELGLQAAKLQTVSPLATLARGYAIVSDAGSGRVITQIEEVSEGQKLTTRLQNGEINSTVTGKKR